MKRVLRQPTRTPLSRPKSSGGLRRWCSGWFWTFGDRWRRFWFHVTDATGIRWVEARDAAHTLQPREASTEERPVHMSVIARLETLLTKTEARRDLWAGVPLGITCRQRELVVVVWPQRKYMEAGEGTYVI